MDRRRVAGGVVLDMACGEGYGSSVLASTAASVVGVDGNPEAHEHARLRYTRPGLSFEWGAVETYGEPGSFDAVVFLQTIEHVVDPRAVLEHFSRILRPGGVAYVSTPNVLTLAPPGAAKSDNPWHLREYRAEEFASLCAGVFGEVEMLGLFHARKLRAHEIALRLGWDRVHKRLRDHAARSTTGSRRRSRAGLRAATGPARLAPSTSWRSAGADPVVERESARSRPARPSGTFAALRASGSSAPAPRRPRRWRARSR